MDNTIQYETIHLDNTLADYPYPFTMSKQFTAKEVGEHNTEDKGLYIIVDSNVYEMAGFVGEHPGGAKILKRVGGKDASKQFWKVSCSITDLDKTMF